MKSHYITTAEPYQYELCYPELNTSISCHIQFSKRKSISIQVSEQGQVQVRAPYYAHPDQIERFLESKKGWIHITRRKVLSRLSALPVLSPEEEAQARILEKQLRKKARELFVSRAAYYREFTGGSYTSIAVRDQKSRWGSCSSKGTLSFNYRLVLAPPEVLDYVVVHELCHLTHMDHSKEFWSMVASILPDYKIRRKWLKDHGQELTLASILKKSNGSVSS